MSPEDQGWKLQGWLSGLAFSIMGQCLCAVELVRLAGTHLGGEDHL